MVRIILGVVVGFFTWVLLWVGTEKVLSAALPEWFGAPQRAFQEAIENGRGASGFTAPTRLLLTHIVIALVVAALSGFLSALTAAENKRAPLILGFLLLAVGLLKVVMSWPYVPIWYHVIFTAILLPIAIVGGKLKTAAK
jgi:hypothetical protein